MIDQQEKSRAGGKFETEILHIDNLLDKEKLDFPPTEFMRETISSNAKLLKAIQIGDDKNLVAVILDKTPFYIESGGQISDIGRLKTDSVVFNVRNLHAYKEMIVHECIVEKGNISQLQSNSEITAEIDVDRRMAIQRNHTVTHLTQAALRKVLGPHIKQSGSYVGPDRMRFDFSHHKPMTDAEIQEVEEIVNEEILKSNSVETVTMNLEQAKASGAMALFGEKYDSDVRVVSIGEFSKELCGGTHVENSSQIGPFFITLETGIASGVRRIEAITGKEALNYMLEAKSFRKQVASIVNRPEADSLGGVEHLKEQNSLLQKELKKVKAEMFSGGGNSVGNDKVINDITFSTHYFDETDRDIMTAWIDSKKEMASPVFAVALGLVGGKMTYIAAASSQAVDKNIHIGKITKELLPQFGGRGGGKPNFAQGSVANDTEPSKLFDTAQSLMTEG